MSHTSLTSSTRTQSTEVWNKDTFLPDAVEYLVIEERPRSLGCPWTPAQTTS